ncbi:channel protein, hemolysin III family [Desulfobulbus propionicus DSM 2032]|jgi:hemolysin III|uniref:Channel protein, hemolysin III family n=1 Tax=Desulfobulbus propionicus (strain ATCC 33891 / DSM 2032 / VKM B-1956 / 1pr3) TaxID=577650 RepID=A0A7U4DNC2_DESPD|nr:hemolysin III family protein [Desulfobulbus propionicus]ADW16767.1 channel protein, hemolysin III family [Desulfobulbus propionicus DSM 2032]
MRFPFFSIPGTIMAHIPSTSRYSKGEEIANSFTHGLGTVLAIGGLVVLIVFAALHGNAWHIVSCSIFGAALILLYLASTLYHAIQHPGVKPLLRILDHSAILVLIAGTYTPITLISLRGPWGWTLFGLIWGLAAVGIVIEATRLRRFRGWLIALYVIMGWAVVAAVKPMMDNVDRGGLWLLLAGGLAYTGGIAFYLWRRLPYNHAIWHLFVLAGSVLHYFAILLYVIPRA